MIEKMRKYSFVIYHLDYDDFLKDLQKLGLVHLIRNCDDKTENQLLNMELIKEYSQCKTWLDKLKSTAAKQANSLPPKALLNKITDAREEKERLGHQADVLRKQIRDLLPWGHFDYDLVKKLQNAGLKVEFHTCPKTHFKKEWLDNHPLQIVADESGIIYFTVIDDHQSTGVDADTFSFHQHTLQEFENQLTEVQQRIADITQYLTDIAPTAIDVFTGELQKMMSAYDYEDAYQQGVSEAEDHIRLISGWIPVSLESGLKEYISQKGIIHVAGDAIADDNPPIKLKNNWYVRLFEPISHMYMLPVYADLDLTPFLAPFFMLFFGFCNADMAYGLVLVLIGLFMRRKAKDPGMKRMMELVMVFGFFGTIMGWVMGSILGYDMKEIPVIGNQILVRNNGQIFNLALLIGAIQILFGISIATYKQISSSGFKSGLLSIGTFILLATLSVLGASQLGADISKVQPYLKYPLWGSLAIILLFNSPGRNPIFNILNGIWLLYGIITGFFGDILSYIRLFALGVSSAILGFVVNSIGGQMIHIPIIGPVIFIVFMLAGHTLNIALGALSGFVHSMRLTFVEFFKNAAFVGPGTPYKPFSTKE